MTEKKTMKGRILAIFGDPRRQAVLIPLCSILLSLLAGAIIYMMLGKNPIEAYQSFLQGAGILPKESYAGKKSMLTDFMGLLNAWTPMIFAALSVCVALRAGLFNIGVSGQMLFAGIVTTAVVGYLPLPAIVARPLVLVIGMLAGMLVAVLMGYLKIKWNINEVVTAIMFNYIIRYATSFIIYLKYLDPVSRQSKLVNATSRLTLMNTEVGELKMDISLAIVLAILLTFGLHFLLKHTRLGFEFGVLGKNRKAAQYAGIEVGATTIKALAVSGALAGLAGVSNYLGYFGSIQPDVLSSTGFDAIAVTLLGAVTPIGTLIASFLIVVISKGSTYMTSVVGVRQEIAALITGLILLFSACGAYFRHLINRAIQRDQDDQKRKLANREEGSHNA